MRKVKFRRRTKETNIEVQLNIDGVGSNSVSTGIGFLDHMLSLFSKHGLFDIKLKAHGDLNVDIHHTNEDVGIVTGEAFAKALKDKKGIRRFGSSFAILDEAQVRVVVDISGRPYLDIKPANIKISGKAADLQTKGYTFGYFKQFLRAFISSCRITLHIDIIRGEDLHHILECCFKALGLALDEATSIDKRKKGLPTTKGKL